MGGFIPSKKSMKTIGILLAVAIIIVIALFKWLPIIFLPVLVYLQAKISLTLWRLFRPVLHNVLLLALGYFAFTQPDQALDLFNSLTFEENANWLEQENAIEGYYGIFLLFLTLWSLATHHSSRILLLPLLEDPANSGKKLDAHTRRVIVWVPRLLGLMPFVIIMLAFFNVEEGTAEGLISLGCGLLVLGIIAGLNKVKDLMEAKKKKLAEAQPTNESTEEQPVAENEEKGQLANHKSKATRAGLLITVCLLVLFMLPVEFGIAHIFLPASVILAALFVGVVTLSIIQYWARRSKTPLFLYLTIYLIAISGLHNNHEIRTVENTSQPVSNRQAIQEHFVDWINYRRDDVLAADSIYPVYIVAAQGGGIRSLKWTAGVMEQLELQMPGFTRHVYGFSGVSGGTVGAAFYNAYYRDYLIEGDTSRSADFAEITSDDYLSAVTGAMLFPDMVQNFLPFPVGYFDRARWLEDSWADAYNDHLNGNTFDQQFLNLWKDEYCYQVPGMFINTTVVENGQKAVMSNIDFSGPEFPDVKDIHQHIENDVPLKTAALLSARFPYVTPPGTALDSLDNAINLVDGGYFENTGLGTANSILDIIVGHRDRILHPWHKHINRKDSAFYSKVVPVILFIKNGYVNLDDPESSNFMLDILAPPNAFVNAWGRRDVITADESKSGTELLRNVEFRVIELDRDYALDNNITLPLGWYLSDNSSSEFDRQLQLLSDTINVIDKDKNPREITNIARSNYGVLEEFREWHGLSQ